MTADEQPTLSAPPATFHPWQQGTLGEYRRPVIVGDRFTDQHGQRVAVVDVRDLHRLREQRALFGVLLGCLVLVNLGVLLVLGIGWLA